MATLPRRKRLMMTRRGPTTGAIRVRVAFILIVASVAFIAIVVGWMSNDSTAGSTGGIQQKRTESESATTTQLCSNDGNPAKCQCQNPLVPFSWPGDPLWAEQHHRLVRMATSGSPNNNPQALDVVFLGDSITERLNGTRHLGTVMLPENRLVFEQYFNSQQQQRSGLSGLALGSSGDVSANLLWHLQNGMLPDSLQPKVWMILIGTNDLGRLGCSAEATLSGVLNVLHWLQDKRPKAMFLVHGLLPRSDNSMKLDMTDDDYKTGYYWEKIQLINQELQEECAKSKNCHYLEVTDLFLNDDKDKVNAETMTDALHPSAKGYELWCPVIAQTVKKLLAADDSPS